MPVVTRPLPLKGRIALVAGATRGAGRGIAVELGHAGATVYVTGRTTRESRSPMNRPETIEETAELVDAAGGAGVPVRVDHSRPDEVAALIDRIASEHDRLDLLVNDVWGGDPMIDWEARFWEHSLADGIAAMRQAIETHLITSWHAVPLMLRGDGGLVIEVNDGTGDEGYRENLFYDLAKYGVLRLATAEAEELRGTPVTVVCLSPGFLRSEAMLDHFGVTEETWRQGGERDRHFLQSETPRYIGRAVAALAADPEVSARHGEALTTGDLSRRYGFTDVDGQRPDFHRYYAELLASQGADPG